MNVGVVFLIEILLLLFFFYRNMDSFGCGHGVVGIFYFYFW